MESRLKIRRGSWLIPIGLIVFSLALLHCRTITTSTTAKNLTQPVVVGPILNVKGDRVPTENKGNEFDIAIQVMKTSQKQGYTTVTTLVEESEEKIDVQLLKAQEDPSEKILVDKIYIHSSVDCIIVFCSGRNDYSGIEGAVYGVKPKDGKK